MPTCALCKREGPLHVSHYIPAALSRRMHGTETGRLRPPVYFADDIALYDERQLAAPLLCSHCEYLFKVQGEDWAIDCSAKQSGLFKLRDQLLKLLPDIRARHVSVYFAGLIPSLRYKELAYFAASIFWRGRILDWSRVHPRARQLHFPEAVNDQLREYLLGNSGFPTACTLVLEVAMAPFMGVYFPNIEGVLPPKGSDAPNLSRFHAFGLTFTLSFPTSRIASLSKLISITEFPHAIFLSDASSSQFHGRVSQMMSSARKVGALAKELESREHLAANSTRTNTVS
jgi:hypothetical protein